MKSQKSQSLISLCLCLSLIVGLFLAAAPKSFADTHKNNMRAAWVATVMNLDFPTAKGDPLSQKAEFVDILDKLSAIGINTVVVQVRPTADALYKSAINPWSEVLTGTRGKDPGYDPMAFMIEETHKRGMSFHAWLNPYRITTGGKTDLSALPDGDYAKLHPELVITYNNALYYNPDSGEVKKHIIDTVKEIVKNYNVDGIHFDDYFYPSGYPLPPGEGKDGTVANGRRDTVNHMVALVSEAIKSIKPDVIFGISPMGVWKNKTSDPTGSDTNGAEAYYKVFSDCRAWIKASTIDYIAPQIYWPIGHKSADYAALVEWWSKEVEGSKVTLYIGQAAYSDPTALTMGDQLALNGKYPSIKGSIFFRASDLLKNRQGVADTIKTFYSTNPGSAPGIPPVPQAPPAVRQITALPSSHKVIIAGNNAPQPGVLLDAYNIDGYNYFKLRDIAAKLADTPKYFNTSWDEKTTTINLQPGVAYVFVGGELAPGNGLAKTAQTSTAFLMKNSLFATAESYNIDGNNYYKLRDLANLLGFEVLWDPGAGTITIKAY